MNTLDSRSLSYTDCFMQKFSTVGEFTYQILPSSVTAIVNDEERFTIQVKARESRSSEATQHHVKIERRDGGLAANPARVVIENGDVVVWNTPDSSIAGYLIRGDGRAGRFASDAMCKEAVYSHSFGTPGKYHWLDPHGGPASGMVEVHPMDASKQESAEQWREKLGDGTVIIISGRKVTPNKVKVLVGQTVFWAVEKASGVAIADARLVSKPTQSAR